MDNRHYLFTSESVGEGHPDKLCDQISDAILDACLANDSESHVAVETFASTALVLVGGEVSTSGYVDVQEIARSVARKIGYTNAAYGLDCDSMAVLNMIHEQSKDINQGVVGKGLKEYEGQQGAGDQGMMFGFACKETPELMPAPIMYSHKLMLKATELRKSGALGWLRPDAKGQVTVEYEGHTPKRIDTVVISHQHSPEVKQEQIRDTIIRDIIRPVLEPTGLLDEKTKFFINPTGNFVIGGPFGDTGLTGRKIIVDTYGGYSRHGGGAFSGKDPSKVDRSGAYMARYVAKNIVSSGMAQRCEVQIGYAIGVAEPVSLHVETFGTETVPTEQILKEIQSRADLTPYGIEQKLHLKRPIYEPLSCYGHFGNNAANMPWEQVDWN